MGQVNLAERSLEHTIGELARALGQPGLGGSVEFASIAHAIRSREVSVDVRRSASRAARNVLVA